MSDLRRYTQIADKTSPDEETSQWRSWQMDTLPELVKPKPVRNIDNNKSGEEARTQGHAQGYQEGYKQGLLAGQAAGHAQGLEAGLAEGRAQALEDLQTHCQDTLAPLVTLMQSLEQARSLLDEEVSSSLVELALTVGRQLAREALDARPETVLFIVRDLLHSEPAIGGSPRLWLHPEDLKLVEQHLQHETRAAGWHLQPDDQIQRGGCRLNSRSGEIDASWEERLDSIRRQVRKPRRARRPQTQPQARSQTQPQKKASTGGRK